MDYFKQFVIPFSGLKPGIHQFEFRIDDTFFEHFEYSEIRSGIITAKLDLEKEEKLLVLMFSFDGTVTIPCDRCFEPLVLPLTGKDHLVVKFGEGYYEENEDLQVIPEGQTQIDVSPFIYEYVNLHLPVRRVHPDNADGTSTCDPEIIRKLEELSESHAPDPRWDVLNDLLKKDKS